MYSTQRRVAVESDTGLIYYYYVSGATFQLGTQKRELQLHQGGGARRGCALGARRGCALGMRTTLKWTGPYRAQS